MSTFVSLVDYGLRVFLLYYKSMKIKEYIILLLFIVVAESAGFVGSFFTIDSISTWYTTLAKPALNPPNWIFGPVWTTLYFLMGVGAFLVWRKARATQEGRRALVVFLVHLIANSLWSIIFFGLQEPGYALVWIVFLLGLILFTTFLFYRISRWAAYLFVPYVAWVCFATYLNYSIWVLN